ncbi:histidine phosphatase superfamily [Scheffersomyces coipomensis]|uniref:histidine phosphatase superfamily n=1 Tax=Scheffersomyces coipomensis TaxID=1788519 RepID=UPI00315CFAC4
MSELYFFRHARRIDHDLKSNASATPLFSDYQPYDPSLSTTAIPQIQQIAHEILSTTTAFDDDTTTTQRKNVFIHFSPYLRCCQSADLLVTYLKKYLSEAYPHYKIKFSLLCDFALSEWVHDKMRNKPPFHDSNDAYEMYTPNLKTLQNKNCCSNFRPTNTLGGYNGHYLSYSDYQSRCKTYFQKLLATYDKPIYLKNRDLVIIISHGYAINNFLSYFISHPIFEEIPESKLNFASRVLIDKDDMLSEEDELNPEHYTWKLFKDALDLMEREPDLDTTLNLDSDIVYYKTNFIKRDDYIRGDFTNPIDHNLKEEDERPRPSFKMYQPKPSDKALIANKVHKPINYNHICPAAKDWDPKKIKEFQIKNEFLLKMINDEAFKKNFDLSRHPSKPITPEVSPNSEPSRNNSVIDLSKLVETDENYKPLKLRYSSSPDVSIHDLNSKVNSQVNLAQYRRSPTASSNEGSAVDLARLMAAINMRPLSQPGAIQIQRFDDYGSSSNEEGSTSDLPTLINNFRKRSLSNPANVTVQHNAKDSYFPSTVVGLAKSSSSETSLVSPKLGSNEELDVIKEHHNEVSNSVLPPISAISRSRSLNHKRESPYFLTRLQKEKDESLNERLFSLSFNDPKNINNNSNGSALTKVKSGKGSHTSSPHEGRSRGNSIKFIPSVLSYEDKDKDNTIESKMKTKIKPLFYNLDSDEDDEDEFISESDSPESSSEKRKPNDYIWFGNNRN